MSRAELTWLIVGFSGQALFAARFLAQWLYSERQKRSAVPVAFWYFSLAGGLTLLAYAIYRRDPVFFVGQLSGLAIYARNLQLIHRERQASTGQGERSGSAPEPEQEEPWRRRKVG